jgi:hypothetical protein
MAGIAAAAGQDAGNGRKDPAATTRHRTRSAALLRAAIKTNRGMSAAPSNSSISITASGSTRITKPLPPSGLKPKRRNSKPGKSSKAWATTSPPS